MVCPFLFVYSFLILSLLILGQVSYFKTKLFLLKKRSYYKGNSPIRSLLGLPLTLLVYALLNIMHEANRQANSHILALLVFFKNIILELMFEVTKKPIRDFRLFDRFISC